MVNINKQIQHIQYMRKAHSIQTPEPPMLVAEFSRRRVVFSHRRRRLKLQARRYRRRRLKTSGDCKNSLLFSNFLIVTKLPFQF